MAQFEAAAQAAMDSIPDEFQPYLENTMFIIEESSPEGLLEALADGPTMIYMAEAAGLHRAKTANVFTFADSTAGASGGKVFVIK